MSTASPEAICAFWFGELQDGFAQSAHREQWFASSGEFDAEIRNRFETTLQALPTGELDAWRESAEGCLALILLTDQFPRNIYRDSARAFAWDAIARELSAHAVRSGYDLDLGFDQRAFVYMPFMHSEDLLDQHTSVGLFTALRDDTPAGFKELTGGNLRHAHQHRDTIVRFRRFPYRNVALGRTPTAAEEQYLASR